MLCRNSITVKLNVIMLSGVILSGMALFHDFPFDFPLFTFLGLYYESITDL
jgi:hypothetical protein